MINLGLGIGVSLPFLEAMPAPGTAHSPALKACPVAVVSVPYLLCELVAVMELEEESFGF